jgi:hypothetical protein
MFLARFGSKQYMKYKLFSQYFIFVATHQRPTIGILAISSLSYRCVLGEVMY